MGLSRREYRVTILPGDGVGPEVIAVGERVLGEVAKRFSLAAALSRGEIGQCAVERHGVPLTPETLTEAQHSDAVLLGAVGGPEPDKSRYAARPEAGLLALRKGLDLYANLRPVRILPPLVDASPLKPAWVAGADLLVVRELLGGVYFGEPRGRKSCGQGDEIAFNTMSYTASQIERVVRLAFGLARQRTRRLVSVDKANVLEVSLLWRDVVNRVRQEFQDVELSHQYVDNCAMQLIQQPRRFDVIVTGNLFGDILSDEAAVLAGSIGMLPSASLGSRGSLYEPVHGSAPDIAGKDIANPLATVLSVAMMFRYAFNVQEASELIERAVLRTLEAGYRTADIYTEGMVRVGTREMGDRVLDEIARSGAGPA
ncbi:MAG: 3-isopropylmalate dehydrogenase [bacterium]